MKLKMRRVFFLFLAGVLINCGGEEKSPSSAVDETVPETATPGTSGKTDAAPPAIKKEEPAQLVPRVPSPSIPMKPPEESQQTGGLPSPDKEAETARLLTENFTKQRDMAVLVVNDFSVFFSQKGLDRSYGESSDECKNRISEWDISSHLEFLHSICEYDGWFYECVCKYKHKSTGETLYLKSYE